MLQKLQNVMSSLSAEATQLVSDRETLKNRISDINTRLTQIVGAMTEIDKLIKEVEDGTIVNNDE